MDAAFSGDLESLKHADLSVSDSSRRTPLHFAVAGLHPDCVTAVLERNKALLNVKDDNGCTALHYAAIYMSIECARVLVSAGIDVEAADKHGRTALALACACGNADFALLFVDVVSNKSALSPTARVAATHAACQTGNHALLAALLARNPLFADAVDASGVSAVHVACLAGSMACVSLLLESKRIQTLAPDHTGATPLHYACAGGNETIVELLLQQTSPMCVDHSGNTPLHFACRNGHTKIAASLLRSSAVTPVANIRNDTPAHLACFGGHVETLQLFESRLPKHVDGVDSPLHKAAFNGHARCVSLLLPRYDVNARGENEATALHKAAFSGSEECVRLLLAGGANTMILDAEGALPLHKACLKGKLEAVTLLLQSMDLTLLANTSDTQGCTPLHMAAVSGSPECVALCLSKFKESVSGQGFAWPHYAAMSGNAKLVDLLSEPQLTCLTQDGRTPKDIASALGHKQFCLAITQRQSGGSVAGSSSSGASQAAGGSLSPPPSLLSPSSMQANANSATGGAAAAAGVNAELIARAVALFNNKPQKGIQFLVHHKLVEDTPDALARFMFETDSLSKRKIGEIISENDEQSQALTNAFLRQLDFAGKDFDAAIRLFLSKFMLPGEAQKIDRVMEMFASRYYEQNKDGVFAHADTCYVLAFAVVMLNTDLHSPNVKKDKKMTKPQWQNHVRGINDGKDLPLDYVNDIYDKIRNQEIKMESETNMFAGAGKKGYCMKQGGKIRTWKKRFFILSEHQLFYFKKATDEAPLGIIPLENLTVERDDKAVKFGFRLTSTDGGFIKSVRMVEGGAPKKGNHTYYVMAATSVEEQSAWIDALQQEIHRSPYYALLIAKKSPQK